MWRTIRHWFTASDDDVFAPYRNRLIHQFTIASLIIFAPFSLANFVLDRVPLGVVSMLIILILVANNWAIRRRKQPPVPLWVLIFPVVGAMITALLTPLYMSLAWTYPMVILFYFILPRGVANTCVLVTIGVGGALMLYFLPPDISIRVTTRVIASLTLTAVFCNIFLAIISDLHRQLLHLATVDPLTGAYNRRHMQKVLEDAFQRAGRSRLAASLLVIDIDHFKTINDRLGHAAGDQALVALTNTLRNHVRSTDALFRMGGEEFLIFLPETTQEAAASVAEKLRQDIESKVLSAENKLTISVGVSGLRDGDTLERWMEEGDKALYGAKNAGRNRVVVRG